MIANDRSTPGLRLRKAEFDAAAAEFFGSETRNYRVAECLGIDPTTLSLLRNGRRGPNPDFIAKVLTTFPDAKFEQFFEDRPGAGCSSFTPEQRTARAKAAAYARWANQPRGAA